MSKQMRKGTRSCLTCRRRKVRCSLALKQSSACDQCARRNIPCLPQGGTQSNPATSLAVPMQMDHNGTSQSSIESFFEALDALHHWVSLPEARTLSHSRRVSSLPQAAPRPDPEMSATGSDVVQSNYAPVMKLFNDHRIGRQETSERLRRASGFSNNEGDERLSNLVRNALCKMVAVLPSKQDITNLFLTRSEWWETWRESFGLEWGEEEDRSLESFAIRAVHSRNPSLLGTLLVCFALSDGNHSRYLEPVEEWILSDRSFKGHAYDYQCMIALGLCQMSALQPCRAWSVFRTANTRLQLAGIHKTHRKTRSFDTAFWQIFGADRWISLMIGLPYSIPDHLCDLHVPEPTESTRISFHYQNLTVLTGRVIDTLQSNGPVSLSQLIAVEEKIDDITAQLPQGYLDIQQISSCADIPHKSARLYRLLHIHQLKSFLYLPYFLQHCEPQNEPREQRHASQYGKTACAKSARSFLEAFLALFDLDPTTAQVDNSMKLSAFSALAAGVVLYLNVISSRGRSYGHTEHSESVDTDMTLINRTISVLYLCSESQSHSLCGQCHRALNELASCGGTIGLGNSRQITVPYFGAITISRDREDVPPNLDGARGQNVGIEGPFLDSHPAPSGSGSAFDSPDLISPELFGDISFSYEGPWGSHEIGTDWLHQSVDLDLYQHGLDTFDAAF